MPAARFLSLFSIIIFSLFQSLSGQTFQSGDADKLVKDSKLVRLNPKNKNIQFIQIRDDAKIEDKDNTIWLGKVLKISNRHSFKEISRSTDQISFTHIKYQLHYKDLPVEGAIYSVHSKAGRIVSASGDYTPGNDLSEIPRLSEPDAFEAAIKFVHAKEYRWEKEKATRPQGRLVILPMDEKYVLAYKYDIYALQPLSRQYIFIDANTGSILKILNRIQEDNAAGKAETMYNGTVNITTDSYSGSFRLREKGRGDGIETYDMNKAINITNAVDFTDDDNYWNTSADFDKAAYDAHYGAEATYDYFYLKFGLNSFDDNGALIKSYVHYNDDYLNAFWDGNYVYYGDGDGVNKFPFTSLDIVAHEISHGVDEYSAGLVYEYESGALNESFSDIMGVSVDFYKNPSSANYQIGEKITVNHKPLRDMSNPNSNRNPDTYKGLYWDPEQEVHCNSGVQNFWYYLLCEGGTGINDLGNSYRVERIGIEKAALIAYRTLTVYLTPNSDYDDARFYSIQATRDLFGECSPEPACVSGAWYAVGIGDANDCFSPSKFTANQTGSSQISLNWVKNVNNNDVLIAYSLSNNIGNPDDGAVYAPENSIPGGGVVIYSGSDNFFNHTGLTRGTKYYYKAWSIKVGNSYSGGVSTTVISPVIDAGEDKHIVLPVKSEVILSGKFPDGLPTDSLAFKWAKTEGKGTVIFDNTDSLNTIAHFNEVGKYTLQFSVSYFGLLATDSMSVIVSLTDSITNHIFTLNNHQSVEVRDNYLYVASIRDGLTIFDISDAENPIEISDYYKFGFAGVHVEGDYAYVSQSDGVGLTILNIKDKYHITPEGYFDIPNATEIRDFVVRNGIVYLATQPEGLIVIDATNPAVPVKIGGFPCTPVTITIIDNYLYGTDKSTRGFSPFLMDISDPANPRKVTTFPKIYAEFFAPEVIQGEYLYRCQQNLDTNYYFCIYDISNRLNPKLTGATEISWNNSSISVQGNYAYLNDGLRVIDISDKSRPVEVSDEYVLFENLAANRNIIYCAGWESLVVYKSYLSNRAPYVYAGVDRNIDSIHFKLRGEVFDEGLPMGLAVNYTWSKVSGPGNVSFSDIHNLSSYISFPDTGRYVVRLSATDGELSAYDEVQYYYTTLTILKQPIDQSACLNARIDLSVEVSSKTSVSYQWYKDDNPLEDDNRITGSGTKNLTIQNTTLNDAGGYNCLMSNGMSYRSKVADIIVMQKPGAVGSITGSTTVCKGSSIENYTVNGIVGATSYIWTLPPGAVGVSTTNSISVSFDNNSTSGNIKVKGHNDCGNGAESTFVVTIREIPGNPVITFKNGILQSDAIYGNQWYCNNQPVANAVNSTLVPLIFGDYYVIVTLNNCSSQPSNIISCISTDIDDAEAGNEINVYPNPASDAVKIVINTKFDSDFIIDVYDNVGVLVRTLKKSGSETISDVDLSTLSSGLYIIRIYNPGRYYQTKVIKK